MKVHQIIVLLSLTLAHAAYARFLGIVPITIWQAQYFEGGIRDAVEFILKPEALSDVKSGLDPALFVAKTANTPMRGGWFADGFAGIRGALKFYEPRYAEGVLASLRGYATELKSGDVSPLNKERLSIYRASLYSRLYDLREANPQAFDKIADSGTKAFRSHVENKHNVVIPQVTKDSDKPWGYYTHEEVVAALKKTGADFEEHAQHIRQSFPHQTSTLGSSRQIPVGAGSIEVKA